MGADVRRYGLYDHGELVGVHVYGEPSNPLVLTNWLEPGVPALMLQRVCLLDRCPGNVESWFAAACRQLLTEEGFLASLTMSDDQPLYNQAGRLVFGGHIGYQFQGDNWTWCGRSTRGTVLVLEDDSRLDRRSLQKIRKQEQGHEGMERHLIALGAPPLRAGENPASWLNNKALPAIKPRRLKHKGCLRYIRPHRRDVHIIHKGRRIRHDPTRYPKPEGDLLSLLPT